MNDLPLPKESDSQQIGQIAVRAFSASMPLAWRQRPLDGDSDVGLDAIVQVVSEGRYAYAFLAQIKGSTVDKLNADHTHFSVALKVSTLNYYRRVGRPLMLIYADLSKGLGLQSPVYYLWIHDELAAKLDAVDQSNDDSTLTFHVPVVNRIHLQLDVVPYLKELNAERLSLDDLQRAIAGASLTPASVGMIQRVAENVRRGGASYVESLQFPSDQPWPDAEPGTVTWQLKQLNDSITNGAATAAESIVESLSSADLGDMIAKAEFEFQKGRLANLTMGVESALPHYHLAHKLQPDKVRYFCPKCEAELHASKEQDAAATVLAELTTSPLSDDARVKALRARCLMLQQKFSEANSLLEGLPDQHAIVERAMCMYLQGKPESVKAIIDAADAANSSRYNILALRVIWLRSRFEKIFRTGNEVTILASGPPGASAEDLQSLWDDVYKLATELRAHGWPSNSQILMDVVMSCGLAVGRASESLVLLDDFLRARPHLRDFQLARMKVAVFAERYEDALDAVGKLPPSDARTIHSVLVRYEMKDYPGVCKLIPDLLAIANDSEEHLRDALAVAAHAARSAFDVKLAEQCIERLKSLPDTGPTIAIYEFVVTASSGDKSVLGSAIAQFREAYEKWPESRTLQDQLFGALRPKNPDEAQLSVTIASQIRERRKLFGHEVAHLALCLRELGRLEDAAKLLEEARVRLPSDITIPALLAMILEDKGESGRALAVLENLLSGNRDAPEFARSVFVQIAARNGLIDTAIAQFQNLLSSRTSKEDKREIYRALFSLEVHRKADPDRAIAIAFQYGAHADQTDERQEGVFLQFVTMCSTIPGCNFTPAQQEEAKQRSDAFLAKFPDSKVFSSIAVSPDAPPEEFLLAMRKKLGITDERLLQIQNLVKSLHHGSAAIPYALRPRRLLMNVASVPHLWEITKRTEYPSGEYHLLMNKQIEQPRELRSRDKVPLMDMTTLLIASDLGILELIIKLYGRIAVSKVTLLNIQYEASHLGFQTDSLAKLRETLTTKIDSIVQPGKTPSDDDSPKRDDLQEFREICKQNQFVPYTDDVCLRLLTLGDEHYREGVTTPDVIETAERSGLITIQEAAQLYAKLARWNIGHVPLQYKHFVASIPLSVDRAASVTDKIEVLAGDAAFSSFAHALWDFGKPYKEVHDHAASVVAKILSDNPNADERLIAAIVSIWLNKVMFRRDPKLDHIHHLASVFLHAFLRLEAPAPGPRRLWGAFKLALEQIHRDRMDDGKLREALEMLARVVAALPNKKPERLVEASDLVETLLNAIGSGSTEADWFDDAYQRARAESALTEVQAQ